jgi:hypothetical protein
MEILRKKCFLPVSIPFLLSPDLDTWTLCLPLDSLVQGWLVHTESLLPLPVADLGHRDLGDFIEEAKAHGFSLGIHSDKVSLELGSSRR